MAHMKLPFTSEAFAKGFLEGVKYVNDSSVDTDNATITPVRDDLFILEFEDEAYDKDDDEEEEKNSVKLVTAVLYFSDEHGIKCYLSEKPFQDPRDPAESAALRQKIEKELIDRDFDDRLYAASCSPVVEFIEQDDEQDDDTE